MKILHIYKNYAPTMGGIENHIKVLAEQQAADGHDVTVLATNATSRTTHTEMNGVNITRAGRLLSIASTPISLALYREVARQTPDITHLHFPYPVGETAHLLFGQGPTVISYQSDIVRQKRLLSLYKPIMNRVLDRAQCLIASSPKYVETSVALCQRRARCTVVPLCIDSTRFAHPHTHTDALKQTWKDRPTVLFVGVLRYYKGVDYLLQAMIGLNARLVVVGQGPMERDLRAKVNQLALQDQIEFHGAVDDDLLPAYYQAADAFCLPACARSEAYGIVLLEALAAGLPIISTELGTGTSYVNRHNISGLVVPPRNPIALHKALGRLLEDADLRTRLARGAVQRSEQFSIDNMMHQIYEIYDQARSDWNQST